MILLLGASGYIGEAFAKELQRRKTNFVPLSRHQVDYTRFDALLEFLKTRKPAFVINAAGYTGKPNVDACELHKADTLQGNTLFPQTVAQACATAKIPWGHVSSGCIYSGAKIVEKGKTRVEKDFTKPELRALVEKSPQSIHGFTETDTPNFSFRDGPCSFYSGTKALGEEAKAIERILKPKRKFEFWKSDEEFYKVAAKTPRSNCVMDTTKLLATGVKIRGVEEALEDSLKNWKPE
jgi:dTDP-4-dehydrorhamnose reductase